jgi:single-strand DNA-binding protein
VNEATLTLTGNVATAIRFARTDKGTALASFRLACTPRRFDRNLGSWVDERTTFLTVLCFRALAENVATSLTKGDPVIITGKLRVMPWERDDKSGISVEVDASAVGHDLNRGQTTFARVRKEITSEERRDAANGGEPDPAHRSGPAEQAGDEPDRTSSDLGTGPDAPPARAA